MRSNAEPQVNQKKEKERRSGNIIGVFHTGKQDGSPPQKMNSNRDNPKKPRISRDLLGGGCFYPKEAKRFHETKKVRKTREKSPPN